MYIEIYWQSLSSIYQYISTSEFFFGFGEETQRRLTTTIPGDLIFTNLAVNCNNERF